MTPAHKIAAGLSEAAKRVLRSDRFDPKGWEPGNPFAPALSEMVEAGLFRRADGRCGFEALKDAFVVPTDLCLAVRAALIEEAGRA